MSPHPAPPDLARRIAQASADLVRPVKAGFTQDAVRLPLRLVAALTLGHAVDDALLVAVVADATGARWTVPAVDDGVQVRRAVVGDGVAEALVATLSEQAGTEFSHESARFTLTRWHGHAVSGERAIAVDQTNESVVVGEEAIVKWTLQLPAEGRRVAHPAPARLKALADHDFDGTARPWGVLRCIDEAGSDLLLATVTSHLTGAVDGWEWVVQDVEALALGALDESAALAPAEQLGRLVAQMHAAFAETGREAATEDQAQQWALAAQADLDEALRLLGADAEPLASLASRVALGVAALGACAGTPLIDIHGDLHVGQVLRYGDPASYAVIDFDGSPVVPPEHRTQKRPAAVDVAGMMAALDHAGRIVQHRKPDLDTAVVLRWIERAEATFLAAYCDTLAALGLTDLLDERLLLPLRLQQECREYQYAVRYLPHWRYAPDLALPALLEE